MLLAVALCLVSRIGAQREVVVSPNGSDANPGTSRLPVATLRAARDRARALDCHLLTVMPGHYRLTESFTLEGRDSGLTVRAGRGPRPVIVGGIEIPSGLVKRCEDRSILDRIIDPAARPNVMVLDLKALGVDQIAPIVARGFPHAPLPAPNEFFQQYTPYVTARWPNTGFTKVGKVLEPGNGEHDHDKPKRQPVFMAGDRAKLWANADDLWMYGYWKYDWADESIRVSHIDANTGTVTLENPSVYGVDTGTPFFVENLIEELDYPGEYYIDRLSRRLYFINRDKEADAPHYELSTLGSPLISMKDANNVTVRGLDFCISRGDGAEVKNGFADRFEGCCFYSLGGRAAVIEGRESGLQSCNISLTGEGGVNLSGGDRKTLAPAHNFVENCDIHEFERRSQTYRPAVQISGVGNRVAHCAIHDAPHSAIIYSGNDHSIVYNEFYRTISLTGDGGVVYTGRDWTARGTVIGYNHFHDNVGMRKWEPAIYVDDLGSGIMMVGNLIERCHWGFLIGGGRDNILERNVLVDCDLAFDCDARGLGWAASSRPTMMERLLAVPYQAIEWTREYPGLANILNENPMAPSKNVLRDNLLIRSGTVEQHMEAEFKKTMIASGNIENGSVDQINKVLPVPARMMGLQKDSLRATLQDHR